MSQVMGLLPFSDSHVCKTHLSGQLFLLLRGLPAHGNLWISPPVSVSHPLHRHFTSGRSHYPGRPASGTKLAKLFGGEPQQIQGGIEISVDRESKDQALIGTVLEGHAFLDVPAARTAFGRGKPARGDEEVPSRIGDFRLQQLQELPHCSICHRPCQVPSQWCRRCAPVRW